MRMRSALLTLATALAAQLGLVAPAAAQHPAAAFLSQFDIDGLGGADVSPDSDGDGLPDNWEVGGLDIQQSAVAFPAPTAIVPGTPPTPLFSRRPVRTLAAQADTDGDGLSDFVEVFGLRFIDDDGDGRLGAAEWRDFNADGMPSINEYPLAQVLPGILNCNPCFDFDGFVFTDPTNADTDGDGVNDSQDNEPLVNPRAFGRAQPVSAGGETDFDNDGLGDNMDLGNDVLGQIDNPRDLQRVIQLFRSDLIVAGQVTRVPEGLIEDLLGADWNGDGLFRLNDVIDLQFGVLADPQIRRGDVDLFRITLATLATVDLGFAANERFPIAPAFNRFTYFSAPLRPTQATQLTVDAAGLPLQELLLPAGRADNDFLPDPRIWTVLYSWRVPGFDIDGNGFIGFDAASLEGNVGVNGAAVAVSPENQDDLDAPTSQLAIANTSNRPDGQIEAPTGLTNLLSSCPLFGVILLTVSIVGLVRSRHMGRALRR